MERFFKRKAAPDAEKKPATEEASVKKLRVADDSLPASSLGDPKTVVSWNCNGLTTQLRYNWSHIREFIEKHQPDVICLQEVRMAAAGPRGCKRGDGQKRKRSEAKQESSQEKSDWQVVENTLIASFRQSYSFYWSLADWKYSGTALLVRKPLRPSHVSYTWPALAKAGASHQDPSDPNWHPEGRVILASFASFDLLNTYAPNNGNDATAFARRAAWDSALKEDLIARKRPLVWIGDLNCAAEDADVTHPEWFLQQCHQGEPEEMRGQPGFTKGERRRFRELVSAGRLIDSFRHLNPATTPPPAAEAHFTWRGHPPVNVPVAKYHGKGMRIDYAMISEELLPRLVASEILGKGAERSGFMGSDHSPILLNLSEKSTEQEKASSKSIEVVDCDDD